MDRNYIVRRLFPQYTSYHDILLVDQALLGLTRIGWIIQSERSLLFFLKAGSNQTGLTLLPHHAWRDDRKSAHTWGKTIPC
jgi:hypothetical protein